jgi:hypothetical protein
MDLDLLFSDTAFRRGWLLEKALECCPLDKAVTLAKSAEQFLTSTGSDDFGAIWQVSAHIRAAPEGESPAPDTDIGSLAVLAVADDIVQYLKNCETTIVPETDGTFLVNGQFRETFDELIDRGNRLRRDQGLPCFSLLPAGLSLGHKLATDRQKSALRPEIAANEDSKPSRHRMKVQDREDWARRVIVLGE